MTTQVFTTVGDCDEDVLCALCHEVWAKPVICNPCEHVFCRDCVANLRQCPECRQPIESFSKPHKLMLKMSETVRVQCEDCDAVMTRAESYAHYCTPKVKSEAMAAMLAQEAQARPSQPSGVSPTAAAAPPPPVVEASSVAVQVDVPTPSSADAGPANKSGRPAAMEIEYDEPAPTVAPRGPNILDLDPDEQAEAGLEPHERVAHSIAKIAKGPPAKDSAALPQPPEYRVGVAHQCANKNCPSRTAPPSKGTNFTPVYLRVVRRTATAEDPPRKEVVFVPCCAECGAPLPREHRHLTVPLLTLSNEAVAEELARRDPASAADTSDDAVRKAFAAINEAREPTNLVSTALGSCALVTSDRHGHKCSTLRVAFLGCTHTACVTCLTAFVTRTLKRLEPHTAETYPDAERSVLAMVRRTPGFSGAPVYAQGVAREGGKEQAGPVLLQDQQRWSLRCPLCATSRGVRFGPGIDLSGGFVPLHLLSSDASRIPSAQVLLKFLASNIQPETYCHGCGVAVSRFNGECDCDDTARCRICHRPRDAGCIHACNGQLPTPGDLVRGLERFLVAHTVSTCGTCGNFVPTPSRGTDDDGDAIHLDDAQSIEAAAFRRPCAVCASEVCALCGSPSQTCHHAAVLRALLAEIGRDDCAAAKKYGSLRRAFVEDLDDDADVCPTACRASFVVASVRALVLARAFFTFIDATAHGALLELRDSGDVDNGPFPITKAVRGAARVHVAEMQRDPVARAFGIAAADDVLSDHCRRARRNLWDYALREEGDTVVGRDALCWLVEGDFVHGGFADVVASTMELLLDEKPAW